MGNGSKKRRRDAWGSITEIERNRRYVIRYWASEDERGYRRHSVTVRGTRADAERKRAELMLDHSKDAPCPTVRQVWEKWSLPAYERRVAEGDISEQSLRQYRSGWNRHAAPRWGDVPCDQVRPLHVQQWIDGLGRSEAESAIRVLKPLVDYAVRYGWVATNPFRERYLMPPKSTVKKRDKGVWSLEELGTIWRDVAWGQWWEAAFLLAAFGGLRVGESIGVRSEDVALKEVDGCDVCVVSVERQIANRGGMTDTLKNDQSHRTTVLVGRPARRVAQIAGVAVGGWLTGDGLGGPTSQWRLSTTWAKAMEGPDFHPFHNLRNSWQTNMRWELRVAPYHIESMMGHAVPGVTGQYYDRPQAEMFVSVMVDAYLRNKFDDEWDWCTT